MIHSMKIEMQSNDGYSHSESWAYYTVCKSDYAHISLTERYVQTDVLRNAIGYSSLSYRLSHTVPTTSRPELIWRG